MMKICIFQQDILWADPEGNRRKVDELLMRQEGAQLYVLPEMFSTGFVTHPEGIAEQEPCETLRWMQQTARQKGVALAGSVALQSEGRYHNRFYFVRPDGGTDYYDKHHLFTYGGEHHRFTAGTERVVVEYGGVRFLLLVCYDLRFPVFSRNRGDYDVMLCVANWPIPRINAWSQLLKARAIENQCYVVGVNRTGNDPACQYCGGSAIIDPWGETVVECTRGKEEAQAAAIDMEALYSFRRQFPVLEDADYFQLNL